MSAFLLWLSGFICGFGVFEILLQIAYRRGIVEYKGIKE